MRPLKYAIAAATLGMLWIALRHHRGASIAPPHRNPAPPDKQPGAHPGSPVEREMEDQAIARAHSEVASGEYDMQG